MATTVFRVEKNREFVVMHNRFLREKRMSLKAKGLLALCLSLPEDWNYSLNGLVAICKESQTSIRSALKELEKFGHLERRRQKDKKGQFIYEYIIYETPYVGFQYTDKQYTDIQDTDIQHTENVIQQSTNKQNINLQNTNKQNLYIELNEILEESVSLEPLRTLYREYIEMREAIEHPLTPRGLKMLITRCERLSNMNVRVQKLLLEKAIINQWKNVFLPKEEEVVAEKNVALNELKSKYGLGGMFDE